MPEAEELLLDGVRHAAEALGRLWQRHRPPPVEKPVVRLGDVKRRLELLIEAVLGYPLPVREAQAGAPVPLARRLFDRDSRSAVPPAPLPANDGTAVYLPPSLPVADVAGRHVGPDDYSLFAMLQALRCERGSAAQLATVESGLVTDLYLLAECVAADHALRRLMPGWGDGLAARRAIAAANLENHRPRSRQAAEVATLYGAFLQGASDSPPPVGTPAAAVDWANGVAQGVTRRFPDERYTPWLGDGLIGRLLLPEGHPVRRGHDSFAADRPAEPADQRRTTALSRRPRARNADHDDDPSPGVWMVQTAEPQPHAEDPLGLNRPEDRAGDDDPQGSAESVAEMAEARLIHTPSRSRETFSSSDPPPRLDGLGGPSEADGGIAYPEWDFESGRYRDNAVRVRLASVVEGPGDWVERTLARHAGTLREIRRRLGVIRPDRQVQKGRSEGEDIDWDALVAERGERRAGLAPAGACYQRRWPAPRRIGLVLLVDASASTDAWVAGQVRVIDVEKEAALLAASALDAAGMDFAVLAFSGEGPRGVQLWQIKGFDEAWNLTRQRQVAGLEPDRYTRLGAALRHAATVLAGRPTEHRLLLLFSDGWPNDCDCYTSRYGIEDARQSVIEARRQGIAPYCFTVDREGGGYLPTIFGPGRYTIVQQPQQLPMAFIAWLRHAARQCRCR
ncbi:hypothetical protein LZ012_10160 [Dechloromonas sp. XY25]|uniref:VWFA domain-containing protein n=1 Tax=Dechloromonas hankyongensis TaxID=2908002 RepID=A0ABS9K2J2_9RHOO|nr:VWA domain-containing protein [Dechloromonas hankyongensis]MCG2577358.1 hypothetical protein [Dechloromonas hankyongensis]